MSAESLNEILGYGTLALQICTLAAIVLYLWGSRTDLFTEALRAVGRNGMLLALVLAALASGLSVYYSGVLGFEPCPLCWWQRAFLYPQVLLFALALWKRDTQIAAYSIWLSLSGLCIALYQHALQVLPSSGLPCPASGSSCAQRIIFELGYITMPLMAASVFAALIVLMVLVRRR